MTNEALGYKTQKSSRITRALQKVVNRIDRFSTAKKPVKKINELHVGSPYQWSPNVTVLSRTKHIAAKKHPCKVCGKSINSGDVHCRIVYKNKDDGSFNSHRYHGNCNMKEDAPTNAMGASSSMSGPIQTFDPILAGRKKMMKRFKKFLTGVVKK